MQAQKLSNPLGRLAVARRLRLDLGLDLPALPRVVVGTPLAEAILLRIGLHDRVLHKTLVLAITATAALGPVKSAGMWPTTSRNFAPVMASVVHVLVDRTEFQNARRWHIRAVLQHLIL